jgi:L,D-transpeptidase ErfK/SrfK
MQVSHGCIRLYNEDIAILFHDVRVGSPGEFLYQPVKVGTRGGDVFVEVHPDIYSLRGDLAAEAESILSRRGLLERVDRERLQRAVRDQSGLPVRISLRNDEAAEPQ